MSFGQLRSPRTTAFLVASIIFVTALVGLVYNHLNSWPLPFGAPPSPPPPPSDGKVHPPNDNTNPPSNAHPNFQPHDKFDPEKYPFELHSLYMDHLFKPSVTVDSPVFRPFGAFGFELKSPAKWTKPMGERLCIIDLDNRPFDKANQIFGPKVMSWDNADELHGLSLGVLNHWLYAKIHGYKYYYVKVDSPEDRRSSWMKPPVIAEILKKHDTCIYLDNDAIFKNLDLPFEWLMNFWEVHPETNSLALAYDPDAEHNLDKFGQIYLNTGFIIAQNNPKTFEVLKAWWECPDNPDHPECTTFRFNAPGRPTDQGGFGTFIRYDYAEDIKPLPCTEANGFPESVSGCEGIFIRHLWTGKRSWVKIAVGQQIPGPFLKIFHEEYRAEKDSFYMTQEQLFAQRDRENEEQKERRR